jgi:hypothetical protein
MTTDAAKGKGMTAFTKQPERQAVYAFSAFTALKLA